MPAGVEERDHDDRADVVDDREREEEQLQVARDLGAGDREDRDGERDVGRHGDRPAPTPGTARR